MIAVFLASVFNGRKIAEFPALDDLGNPYMKRLFEPILVWFENRIDPFAIRQDYEPPEKLIPYIWHYVKQAKWAFFFMLVFGFLNAAVEAAIFSYVGQLVDILTQFDASKSGGWDGLIAVAGPTLITMLVIVLIARVVIVAVGALIEEQTVVPGFFTLVRWQSHSHVVRQSLTFFQNDLTGRVAQKIFQTGHALGDLMIALIQTIGFISAYAVSTIALLLTLNFQLGFIVVFWLVGFVLLAWYFIPKIRKHGKDTTEAAAVVTGRIVDGYSNIPMVKLHGATARENDWVIESLKRQYDKLKLFTRSLTGVRVSLSILSNVMVSLIAWQAISLWLANALTIGEVAFSLALTLRLSLLLNRMMGILNGFFRGVGVTQNSMEMIAQPLGILDQNDAKPLSFSGGRISIEDVRFNYGKSGELFEDFSLEIKPGEKIGIVGPSGAGKSTLISLILRFFEVEGGRISVDGQDIRKVRQDSLRSHFSMVQQETALFHRSVRENIAHGMPNADLDEIIAAAKKAKAHEFIVGLEDEKGRKGYDARVGERGVKLSGGQRQRLAIARVILRDAPILILDEATSQLDSEVEAVIQESLFDLIENKTVIAIAHRLSTLSELDRLIVIDQGKIIEVGTHDELIKSEGLYQKLWERQSGGFIAKK